MESQLKCPKCGSVVYSRRNPICGRCGEKLPESLMFDAATKARLAKLAEQERKQAAWQAKFPGHSTDSGGSF